MRQSTNNRYEPRYTRAAYEAALGRAHRALWVAGAEAAGIGLEGAQEDLRGMEQSALRLLEESLKVAPSGFRRRNAGLNNRPDYA